MITNRCDRLVRRLVSASKLGHLTALHRYKIGGVSLPSLGLNLFHYYDYELLYVYSFFFIFFPPCSFLSEIKPGQWTVLPQERVENLWEEVGGRERVVERKIEALTQQAERMREIGRPSERLEEWLQKHQ